MSHLDSKPGHIKIITRIIAKTHGWHGDEYHGYHETAEEIEAALNAASFEIERSQAIHQSLALEDENKRLREALAEVMNWIDNCPPDFIGDDEWPRVEDAARQALEQSNG